MVHRIQVCICYCGHCDDIGWCERKENVTRELIRIVGFGQSLGQ